MLKPNACPEATNGDWPCCRAAHLLRALHALVTLQIENRTCRPLYSDDPDSAERRCSGPHLAGKLSAQVLLFVV